MNVGLLLNKSNELPTVIAKQINELAIQINFKLYNVSSWFERTDYKSKNMIFNSLTKLEALIAKSGLKFDRINIDSATNKNVDIILCWGTEYQNALFDCKTKILYLYINDERLDNPISGLIETLNNEDYELSIRYFNDNGYIKLASMRCKPCRTFAKTKENAIDNISVLLRKVLKGHLNKQEQLKETMLKKVHKSYTLLLLSLLYKTIKSNPYKKKKAAKSSWNVYVGETSDIKRLSELEDKINLIDHDASRFWADPFIYKCSGINYIFVEEFIYEKKKGIISVLKKEINGEYLYLGAVLECEYHLSYPFIFEINGTVYMIPETGSQKRIDLYKCIEFPLKWEYCRTLLNGYFFTDTTVFFHNNKYWLFTSALKDGLTQDSQLLLYYSDNIVTDNLLEHPYNPIVIGIEKSRMAGNVFLWQNDLIRPAQDCSKIYGGSIRFMKIEKLTESDYLEIQFDRFLPFLEYKGTHTFNSNDDIFVIDAY